LNTLIRRYAITPYLYYRQYITLRHYAITPLFHFRPTYAAPFITPLFYFATLIRHIEPLTPLPLRHIYFRHYCRTFHYWCLLLRHYATPLRHAATLRLRHSHFSPHCHIIFITLPPLPLRHWHDIISYAITPLRRHYWAPPLRQPLIVYAIIMPLYFITIAPLRIIITFHYATITAPLRQPHATLAIQPHYATPTLLRHYAMTLRWPLRHYATPLYYATPRHITPLRHWHWWWHCRHTPPLLAHLRHY